jgi:cobaltochelatase CobT
VSQPKVDIAMIVASDQLRARHLQHIHELCAASIRAYTGDISLLFRGPRLHGKDGPLPLFAPHLHPSVNRDNFSAFRGAADGYSLRLTQSDPAIYRRLSPADAVEHLIFDLLEQFRVESQVPEAYVGMRRNLQQCFEQWSLAFQGAGFIETVHGLILFSLAHICRAKITGDAMDDDTSEKIESTRAKIIQRIGSELPAMRRLRHDQAGYASHSLNVAKAVAHMMLTTSNNDEARDGQGQSIELSAFAFLDEKDSDEPFAIAAAGKSKVLVNAVDGYRAFTKKYDIENKASDLVRSAQLAEFRLALDERVAGLGVIVHRLARQLRALLSTPEREGWNAGEEEGYLDGRRLSQLIVSPADKRVFKLERVTPQADCALTFLVDCSGSMKAHIQSLTALVDIFVRALDMAEVQCEVLGYTTAAWTGGRAQKDWLKAGKPSHPGRLNETSHIVFKSADVSWRRARPSIAGMLKSEIFREGIDGEAVLWAEKRLEASDASRKILVVVSDGSPMDSATNLANDEHYLDHHLRDVVQGIEMRANISIVGIGVGLDMSPYYRKSHVLDLVNSSANQSLLELVDLIGRY